MALHKVKLPGSAKLLFRVVGLQRRLLGALADPALDAGTVNTVWVQNVWNRLDPEWARKFCLGGQETRIQAIAQATPQARQALYETFCRQNNIAAMIQAGGNFEDLSVLPGFNPSLARAVKDFFAGCYALLSHNTSKGWNGYVFNGKHSFTNHSYKDDFLSIYPTRVVCPYCDGEIGTPELDHYLCKSKFPLLSCSPWNLVPVCRSCNDLVTAKGDRPACTLGPPRSTDGWLHPFFRPASLQVRIELSGTPQNSIPQLHSPDPAEQQRLLNHTNLIRSLAKRWTIKAAGYFDRLVREANRKVNAVNTVENLVRMKLDDHVDYRGMEPSSMIHAAVCQAVLDHRPGYLEEFNFPNAPALE